MVMLTLDLKHFGDEIFSLQSTASTTFSTIFPNTAFSIFHRNVCGRHRCDCRLEMQYVKIDEGPS